WTQNPNKFMMMSKIGFDCAEPDNEKFHKIPRCHL
ncbi:MAG: hypothetical protein ACI8VZ_001949, partial [Candidatus Paceibacteria bacterium]